MAGRKDKDLEPDVAATSEQAERQDGPAELDSEVVKDLTPKVEAETGTSEIEPPPAEKERLAEQVERANESGDEKREREDSERAEQQEAAGKDVDEDPVPLSESGTYQQPVVERIADQDVELTTDELTHLRTLPTSALSKDANGIQRIVTPNINDGWTPNPIEPDPTEVARLTKMSAAIEATDAERRKAVGIES